MTIALVPTWASRHYVTSLEEYGRRGCWGEGREGEEWNRGMQRKCHAAHGEAVFYLSLCLINTTMVLLFYNIKE